MNDSSAAEQVLAPMSNQHSIGQKLHEEGEDQKQVCTILTRSMNLDNEEDDPLPVRIRLQLGVDPSQNGNSAIRSAAESGHHRIVKLLLSDARVDPSVEGNEPLRYASKNGHVEVVKLLLSDPRVYSSAGNDYALITAAMGGYVEVVRLLLEKERREHNILCSVDPGVVKLLEECTSVHK